MWSAICVYPVYRWYTFYISLNETEANDFTQLMQSVDTCVFISHELFAYRFSPIIDIYMSLKWAQVEWWLEHRHGWLVKRQWAGSILGWVSRDEYQVLGSTSIPARCVTLVYREPLSWLTSVGTTRNNLIRLGWSRIGLAVLILHAAGVGLTDRPAVISGRYNKYHSLQLHNYYAHFPPLQHTRIHANTTMRNWSWEWSWVSRHCMLTVAGGILCDRVKRPIDH